MSDNYLKRPQDLTNQLFDRELTKKIESGFPEIERIAHISVDEFNQRYVIPGKPVVLSGLVDQWPAMAKWDLNFFKTHCGDVEIKVNIYDIKSSHQTTIKNVIDHWNSKAQQDYLQEWWFGADCPFLHEDFTIPAYFSDDLNNAIFKFYASLLFIGKKNSYTYVHQDTPCTNVWSAQLRGKKQWILFGRDAILPTTQNGAPDVDRFLADEKSEIKHCTLLPGELLFMPHKWWHRVRVLEDSISLHTLYVTQEILPRYLRDLFAIPLTTALNRDALIAKDPMRYDVNLMTCRAIAKLMGLKLL